MLELLGDPRALSNLERLHPGGNRTTSNVVFAEPDHDQLFVTGGDPGAVFRLDLKAQGLGDPAAEGEVSGTEGHDSPCCGRVAGIGRDTPVPPGAIVIGTVFSDS